jgi:5-methyltetrahydrofolate--homocysteine methyltransferase
VSDLHPNIVLDGGIAHTIGRPSRTCRAWSADRPPIGADGGASYAAFVAAGARILTTDTMHLWPAIGSPWAEDLDRAVALARCNATGGEVWGVVPPASMAKFRWLDVSFQERVRLSGGWSQLAARFVAAGVDGLVLQGFADVVECAAAVAEVRSVAPTMVLVASLSPRDDGRLQDGSDPASALLTLRQAGASWVGFGCGTGPASIAAALALAPDAEWARPSGGDLSPGDVAAALVRMGDQCHFVGGCCGVGPEVTSIQWRANQLLRRPGDAADVTRRLIASGTSQSAHGMHVALNEDVSETRPE